MDLQSNQTSVEELCKSIYLRTGNLYGELSKELSGHAFGYKILYSPPKIEPPILFLGFQPGGKEKDEVAGRIAGEREGWPSQSEYATEQWALARKMRDIWDVALLKQCVGFNVLFFRSPDVNTWRTLRADLRSRLEKFCLSQVQELVSALKPRLIVVIGLTTLSDFIANRIELEFDSRNLIKSGTLWGYQAHAIIHLSGARPRLSKSELEEIRRYFRNSHPV